MWNLSKRYKFSKGKWTDYGISKTMTWKAYEKSRPFGKKKQKNFLENTRIGYHGSWYNYDAFLCFQSCSGIWYWKVYCCSTDSTSKRSEP